MAPNLKSLTIFFLVILTTCWPFVSQARPLAGANQYQDSSLSIIQGVEILFEGLYVGAVKTGGPSPGGKGHAFTDDQILGGIKNSGPSPGGEGHGLTLGGIKNSGPSAGGEGHATTLGGIKNRGPSPGGEGHGFTKALTMGEIKESGPSPGEGH